MAADISVHYARINQLTSVAHTLEGLVTCIGLESTYNEYMDTILKLQDAVQTSLHQLLTFKDVWIRYENLSDKVEGWTREAEKNLKFITAQDLPAGNVRQFWVKTLINIALFISLSLIIYFAGQHADFLSERHKLLTVAVYVNVYELANNS